MTVRARAVVVSGGAINTPAILLRSGLKHPMIGRHLCLHPVLLVGGVFPEDYDQNHDHDHDRGNENRSVRQESLESSKRATSGSTATAASGKQVGVSSNLIEWSNRMCLCVCVCVSLLCLPPGLGWYFTVLNGVLLSARLLWPLSSCDMAMKRVDASQ